MTTIFGSNDRFLALVNSILNASFVDVIGNKSDVASSAATASIVAKLQYVIDNLNTDTDVTALIGALDNAAATGAVTDSDTLFAYVKQLVTELQAAQGNITSILADTNELQADLTNGGRLDLLIDAIKAATDKVGTVVNTNGTATIGAILGDFANTTLVSKFNVPAEDVATDATIAQVVGKKSDTVAGNSIVALIKQVLAALVVIDDFIDTEVSTIATSTSTTIPNLLAIPTADLATDLTIGQVVGKKADTVAGTSIVSLVKQSIAAEAVNKAILDGTTPNTNAVKREAGRAQVKKVAITNAANAGLVTIGTVTTKGVVVHSITLRASATGQTDLTSAAVKGGGATGETVEFISAATAIKNSLDSVDEQVSFNGKVALPATGLITVNLQGTGATAVALEAVIEYVAVEDGGYIA